ncbi:multidrug ABC transporter permease [Candidatus Bathyarchaeota archaeon]|nr:MAG: multidrug ABC transporter permease [Candidatus Bathyarchaeota archaeon]
MSKVNEFKPSKLHGLWALTKRELKKWLKEPILLFMAVIQPVIWMSLFGKAMNLGGIFSAGNIDMPSIIPISGNFLIPPQPGETIYVNGTVFSQMFANLGPSVMQNVFGVEDYFSYMSVGMISFIVMFTTMFSGMSMVWDRRLGFLDKVLSTPVSRASIIFAKIFNATLRAMFQATIILILAVLLGLKVSSTFTVFNILGVYAAIFLLCVGLSSVFIALALRSTRQETQMAVVNLINLPLMFASNTFFPISMMPEWIQAIARVNPISYLTDAIRQLTILQMDVSALMFDFAYLGAFAAVLSTVGILLAWKYLTK